MMEGTFSFIVAILILVFILWLLGKSLRLMVKFVLNALVGFVMLLFLIFWCSIWDLLACQYNYFIYYRSFWNSRYSNFADS
ncbi:sigmaK-factor processing regulatory BofA [Thermoanaerobacter ethanolicus JW 200]|nr:sigmaK-factor processing regulatory BofA [Thermoanaerobacter ethanolicus JW 200]